ncbi:outer membrane protein transport protein [Aliivibrio fischeri]|uniref:Long-chain fatty acid transport protein n=1 Tax=Aliivibrio fischeri SR5 TaxID=1088719 RepID=A0AAV3ET01_ALIFS|nr:outer membrane protein transport protein [Aliivibrio fischeri]EHN69978.1 long-chain fatty acid transport protein [Aliivibrio fischeri SR5]MUK25637.1 aromatic hydrocarbon degradation protein [Aliivibrio fischeri]MUK34398.1 aromatic hydrocarbon degradation protein [Aliivibrio fischeri]MUL10607.1 aromatic hydrocarbon degradation protein [Aliivibrio fischeri]MUL15098.1 aromatic hydrocarbon degradation protein [Aliivibrio fischeri]
MNTTFSRTLLATSTLFISATSMAGGFQVNEHSATGLGRAFAGEAVIADNASVLSRNAAAMTMFDSTSISMGLTMVKPDVSVKNVEYQQLKINENMGIPTGMGFNSMTVSNTDGIAGTEFVPNFYVIHPLNDKWAFGFASYSNFGTGTEFEDNYDASIFGGKTEVKSANIGFSLAYKLNEQWSFGAGIDVIYGIGNLYRDLDSTICNKPFAGAKDCSIKKTKALDISATGVGIGGNVGVVYQVNERNRFGLSYKYSPEVEAEGDVDYLENHVHGVTSDSVYLPLPDIAEFSGYHLLTDKVAIHYSYQWIGWSAFDSVDINDVNSDQRISVKEYNWKNSYHIAVGTTYYLNKKWTLRAGYMFDKTPVDEITSISIPDSDRQWFSTGFTYNWSNQTSVDFGFTYLIGEDVEVSEVQDIPDMMGITTPNPSLTATTHADAILAAIQLSHSF